MERAYAAGVIVLVGFMGAGKSSVGGLLAQRLGLPFLDSDDAVEQRAGRAIRDIFAADGEAAFRALERETIADLLRGPDVVLALGGGAVEDAATREALRGHDVVYLEVDLDVALQRVGGDAERPVLRDPQLAARYRARVPDYADVATIAVPTAGRSVADVADEVLARLAAAS